MNSSRIVKSDEGGRGPGRSKLMPCVLGGPKTALRPRIIALGASTGGPGVLRKILSQLPQTIDAPIIVVQHIDPTFIVGFVQCLGEGIRHPVRLAREGDPLHAGTIYVADVVGNLAVTPELRFKYQSPSPNQLYSPNIDHLFTSLSALDVDVFAALLTGMGRDGAEGLKSLAAGGAATFIQSFATCAVDGMPRAARQLSQRHHEATPEELARFITIHSLAPAKRCHE